MSGFGGSSYSGTASEVSDRRADVGREERGQTSTSDRFGAEPTKDTGATDFTAENRSNMWDSIRNDSQEDDLDVPPTLRDRLRGKNRE